MDPIIDTSKIETAQRLRKQQTDVQFPLGKVVIPSTHPASAKQRILFHNLMEDKAYLKGCNFAGRVCDHEVTHEDHINSLRDGIVSESRLSPSPILTLRGHRERCIHEFLVPEMPSAAFLIHGKKSPELVMCYRGEFGILVCCHALWGEESGETFVARTLDDVGYEKTLAILIYRIAMEYPFMSGAGTLFTPVPVWVPFTGMAWDELLAKVQKHLELLSPAFGRDTFLETIDECDIFQVNDLSMPNWHETNE